MNRCLFLDRDGILNEPLMINGVPHAPKTFASLQIVACIRDTIARVTKLGYYTICITNQPDVRRGLIDIIEVNKINNFLLDNLTIDEIYTCAHDERDECDCRKPKIGSFIRAKEKYNIDFSKSFMLGDTWKDVEAGRNAGCKTIFWDRKYNLPIPTNANYYIKNIQNILEVILSVN